MFNNSWLYALLTIISVQVTLWGIKITDHQHEINEKLDRLLNTTTNVVEIVRQ